MYEGCHGDQFEDIGTLPKYRNEEQGKWIKCYLARSTPQDTMCEAHFNAPSHDASRR